ncbi:hypothetical protein QTP88_005120 [Uroleucon formosanum]
MTNCGRTKQRETLPQSIMIYNERIHFWLRAKRGLHTISKHSEALCYYVLLARLPNQLLFETREKGYCGHVRNLTDYDIFIIKSDSKLLTLYLTVLWKTGLNDAPSLISVILLLIHYFCNLIPIIQYLFFHQNTYQTLFGFSKFTQTAVMDMAGRIVKHNILLLENSMILESLSESGL